MKKLILFIISIYLPISAQFRISIPDSFGIIINDKKIEFSKPWYDSLKFEAKHNKMHYQLASYHSFKYTALAKLRIPQTLSFKQVLRQVIFYYGLLDNERQREKEKVLIYPFFSDTDDHESIRCKFLDNNFYFHLNNWRTVSFPLEPTLEEKFIYNQILENAMQNTLLFAELPKDAIKKVSNDQNMTIEEVHKIYKKIVLWNTISD